MKAIAVSLVFILAGLGIMFSSDNKEIVKTIGGGMFIIGLIVFSLTLYNMFKKN